MVQYPFTAIGNVGSTPEMRITPGGSQVTNFSFAAFVPKNPEGDGAGVIWLNVSVWGEMAETVVGRVLKGDKVALEGYLYPCEQYERKDGGVGLSQKFKAVRVTAVEWAEVELAPVKG